MYLKYFSNQKPFPFCTFRTYTSFKPFYRKELQYLFVPPYDCGIKKTLHKYAIIQVTQGECETEDIESTKKVAKVYSKVRAITLTEYKFTAKFSEKSFKQQQNQTGS